MAGMDQPVRVACSSIPFARQPLPEALASVRRVGFRWVELSIHHDSEWGHLRPAELLEGPEAVAAAVRAAGAGAGVGIASLNVNLAGGAGEPGEFEAVCRLGAALDVAVVSLMPRTIDEPTAIARLAEFRAVAAAHGRTLAVETYDLSVFRDVAATGRILAAVPGLRLTLDTGHLLCAGLDQAAWQPLLPHAALVHLKDGTLGWGGFQAPVGYGVLDVPALVAALANAGFGGPWSVEYFGPWPSEGFRYDTEEEIVKMRELLEHELRRRSPQATAA